MLKQLTTAFGLTVMAGSLAWASPVPVTTVGHAATPSVAGVATVSRSSHHHSRSGSTKHHKKHHKKHPASHSSSKRSTSKV